MAFTLKIKGRSIFGNKKVDFQTLLSNCHLAYGSANEFYILMQNEMTNGIAILYNPERMGRGIYFDGSEADKGIIEVSYNIPTTEAEITDFINVVSEIQRQLKHIEMYCVEEERQYTVEELLQNKVNMVQFSLKTLHDFCLNTAYQSYIFTLAKWPFVMEEDQVKQFARCEDLKDFEQLIHDLQVIDAYYAKPQLLQRHEDGKIIAVYTLTEECVSIFPTKAEGFLNLDNIHIDEGFIRFYIYSEDRLIPGLFSYSQFTDCMMKQGCKMYDKEHLLVPSMTKEQIDMLINAIG